MNLNKKLAAWSGPNKSRARAAKLLTISAASREGFIASKPRMLSFAGALARLERAVVARDLVTAKNIITIQTCRKLGPEHDGAAVLRKLIKTRDQQIPGMFIWPYSFKSFSEGYEGLGVTLPSFRGSKNNSPIWYKKRMFRPEMERFLDVAAKPFDIIDIDICGIFSEKTATNIVRLMNNQKFADQGLLFINHQKGRDGRGGTLFEFLSRYFKECPYFDLESFTNEDGEHLDLDGDFRYYWARYILAPLYYTCEAYRNGYHLEVDRLMEYRDRNKKTGGGVNMLQWFFRFTAVDPEDSESAVILEDSIATIANEKYTFLESLD